MRLRLMIFDVDGTLIDSQAQIHTAMIAAFGSLGLAPPSRAAVRGIIGLSLPHALATLAPGEPAARIDAMVEAYKAAYVAQRVGGNGEGASPLYPGARAALDALKARDEVLLGVATGKSRRGLDHLFDAHDLHGYFQTTQVADDHPSKPHPSMVLRCLAETGVEPQDAAILGDTTFDMDMGRAAGIAALGAGWGYHDAARLQQSGARQVLEGFAGLIPALDDLWEIA